MAACNRSDGDAPHDGRAQTYAREHVAACNRADGDAPHDGRAQTYAREHVAAHG